MLGHEMGHYVLNHSAEILLQFALVILAGFLFVHFTFARIAERFARSSKVQGISDPAGLPLAGVLFGAFMLLATPVVNSIIRSNEAEADAFGMAIARQPDGFAYAATLIAEYRKVHPGPLEEMLFFDHPSNYDRIRRAMTWKKEHLAEFAAREAALAPPKTSD